MSTFQSRRHARATATPAPIRRAVCAVMISASLYGAAMTIAAALVTEEEAAPHNGSGLVRATTVSGHERRGRRR